MSYEDQQRLNNGNRKPMGQRYGDGGNYSPSSNYHYNSGQNSFQHQHPRRRSDRFRRESLNNADRLIKQNDIIIRLLKEIRDRLPMRENGQHNYAGQDRGFDQDAPAAAMPGGENEEDTADPTGGVLHYGDSNSAQEGNDY